MIPLTPLADNFFLILFNIISSSFNSFFSSLYFSLLLFYNYLNYYYFQRLYFQVWRNNKAEIISNSQTGNRITPSDVYFKNENETLIGLG